MLEAVKLRVSAAYDDEAGVWYVADSEVPGLSCEAEIADGLLAKLARIVPELIELNCHQMFPNDRPPVDLVVQHERTLALAC